MEERIFEILEKDKNLEYKYNFKQDTKEKALVNLAGNTAKAKAIAEMMKKFIEWVGECSAGKWGDDTWLIIGSIIPSNLKTNELFDFWYNKFYKP